MFLCGTAAVIAPLKNALYKDYLIEPKEELGEYSMKLKKRIEDIQVRL